MPAKFNWISVYIEHFASALFTEQRQALGKYSCQRPGPTYVSLSSVVPPPRGRKAKQSTTKRAKKKGKLRNSFHSADGVADKWHIVSEWDCLCKYSEDCLSELANGKCALLCLIACSSMQFSLVERHFELSWAGFVIFYC